MATLSDLRTYVARDLRDTSNATFSTAEIDDLINQGIDALADVRPVEIVQTIGTVAAGVYSYAASSFAGIFRVDIYTSAGTYRTTLPHAYGDGPNSGWEFHGGVLYLPPSYTFTAGDTIQAWGYGGYAQLSASTATTDLTTSGIWAVRVFAQAEAFQRLMNDRAKFQQWQSDSNNTDVTALGLASLMAQARSRWDRERGRMRRLRRLG
jgi:hypothetical protein